MVYTPDPNDPYRAGLTDEEIRRQARLNNLDNELQPDPALGEGPPSGAKVAMFAIAIAAVLGAVFYGLNNTSVNQAGNTPANQTAQNPATPPGMRDVTPRTNADPGTTTGAATTNRPTPPSNNPTGTEVDRNKQ